MIVEMLKYSFLLYHKDYPDFVKLLKKQGVLHVIEKNEMSDEIRDQISYIKDIDFAIKTLTANILENGSPKNASATPISGEELVKTLMDLTHTKEQSQQQIDQVEKEFSQLQTWGSYSIEKIKLLEQKDIFMSFFTCKSSVYNEAWQEEYTVEKINQVGGQTYFVILHSKEQTIDIDADYFRFPEYDLNYLGNQIDQHKKELDEIDQQIALLSLNLQTLESFKEFKLSEIKENQLYLNTENVAEDKVKFIEGWVPRNKAEQLNKALEEKQVYYMAEEPKSEDEVPVKLKNSKFNKLFEPIGELYTLPDYKEMDLTPFFAPFFLLFFGFCLGDAGYGLVILLGASIYKRKVDKKMKPMLTLAQFLGAATVIFGTLTGTLFGVVMAEFSPLIEWVKQKSLADPNFFLAVEKNAKGQEVVATFLTAQNLFSLAVIIGVIQILFGMIVNVVNITRQKGFKYALSGLGWFIMFSGLVGMFGLSTLVAPLFPELAENSIVVYSWLSVSSILILFFNSPDKNLAVNFGSGLWDAYNMATGFLGDLLSYIRLFALGLSSGILGLVFNSLAADMSGDIPVLSQLIFVIILLVGHGINLFMAALGSFVHPLRLTFVEFYKNAGFNGGGKAYLPFK